MNRCLLCLLALSFGTLALAEDLDTAIRGNTLSINGNATKLGAAQWANPEQSWRTVGELIKTAVPPANPEGKRPNVTLKVALDEKAPWGALKALFMAAAGLGIEKSEITGSAGPATTLALPGADPKEGEVVELPLSAGAAGEVLTENGGRKMPCSPKLLQGLVKQLPQATVHVTAPNQLPAGQVVKILSDLHAAKAAKVAFLPVKDITPEEAADRQEAKDAVDRAFEGGLGGLGK